MKTAWITALLIVAAIAAAGGYWYGRHHAASAHDEGASDPTTTAPSADEEKPVVSVETAPLKMGAISETIAVYGSVVAAASEVRAVSVTFESRVGHVLVGPGESVTAGKELIQIEPSPDALLALQEARNAVQVATRDLKQVEGRFAEHLATNVELSQAQQALQAAELKLKSFTDRGAGESQTLSAQIAGIVSKIDVQEGQIVAAGSALVELAPGHRIEAHLGVDPGDAPSLKVGQSARLRVLDRASAEPIEGKIRTIGRRVDPTTRLVDVVVSLPEDSGLMFDSFVTAELTRALADALIVPRDAALPSENGDASLFTIKDGRAVKHIVHLGLQNDHEVQVIAEGLKPGEPVVISGNYQLEDGMSVEVKP